MGKRIFDLIFSLIFIAITSPIWIVISVAIIIDSRGGIFYRQIRVGKNNKDFGMYKFRTMRPDAEQLGLITIGSRDPRVTRVGYYLRKYKVDEFPQLLNVLLGHMSVVGPRPEVRKYVSMYNQEQLQILQIKPGITDYASLQFIDESDMLAKASDPEQEYITALMPQKLALNIEYIENRTFTGDLVIIGKTLKRMFFR